LALSHPERHGCYRLNETIGSDQSTSPITARGEAPAA